MLVRCQLCDTPLFELTIKENQAIIVVKSKHHHGERHKSLIRIEDLIAKLKEESQMTHTINTVVHSEIAAACLLWPPYGMKGGSNQSGSTEYHEAGNKIIALAEQIKAERAVAGMQAEGVAR